MKNFDIDSKLSSIASSAEKPTKSNAYEMQLKAQLDELNQ